MIDIEDYKILETRTVFKGRVFDIASEKVLMPSGREIARDVLLHRGAAAIVALTRKGEMILLKQYRGPLRSVILEIPAGVIDQGEEPMETAARELKEESGASAEKLIKLTEFYPTPGYSNELLHVYLGIDVELGEMKLEDDEAIEVCLVPLAEVLERVHKMEIRDGKTIIGAILADRYLRERPSDISSTKKEDGS